MSCRLIGGCIQNVLDSQSGHETHPIPIRRRTRFQPDSDRFHMIPIALPELCSKSYLAIAGQTALTAACVPDFRVLIPQVRKFPPESHESGVHAPLAVWRGAIGPRNTPDSNTQKDPIPTRFRPIPTDSDSFSRVVQ